MSPVGSVSVVPVLVSADINDTVIFECLSSAGPDNNVMWVELDGGTIVSGEARLVISPVTAQSAGDYQCTVSNGAGTATTIASLLGKTLWYYVHVCTRSCSRVLITKFN